MEWLKVINKRKTTYRWTSEIPSREEIEKVIQQVHDYCPSKQKKVPFFIDVIDNTDPNSAPNAVKLLIDNKSYIESQTILKMSETVSKNITKELGFMISSIINDIKYSTNQYTRDYLYWKKNDTNLNVIREIVMWDCIENIIITDLINKFSNLEEGVSNKITNLIKDVKLALKNGISTLPELIPGLTRLRMKLWESVDRKGLGNPYDIRNPQVLAPWLLIFSVRQLTENEIGLNHEMKDQSNHEKISSQEIGMASIFAMLSAESEGFDTAFCACIRNKNEIADMLGHDSSEIPVVAVGIGYRDNSPGNTYFNKLVYTDLGIPDSDYDARPEKTKYVKYHVSS